MVSFNKLDDIGPTDPQYYATRQPRSVRDLSSKPFVVPEDTWAERQPARAMPHPLSPEIVPAPPENALQRLSRQAKWQLAAAAGAAVVVAAVMAVVAVGLIPTTEKTGAAATPTAEAASPLARATADLTPAASASADSSAAAAPDASAQPADQPDALLQQFLNWDKNKSTSNTP